MLQIIIISYGNTSTTEDSMDNGQQHYEIKKRRRRRFFRGSALCIHRLAGNFALFAIDNSLATSQTMDTEWNDRREEEEKKKKKKTTEF